MRDGPVLQTPALAYQAVRDFERVLREYTGAPFAVAVNSCTAALLLALEWHRPHSYVLKAAVQVPRHTYLSVPMSVKRARYGIEWSDKPWRGAYQLDPLPVWDCARRFTSGMYVWDQFQCVSFAASKILAAEQGGAILHNNRDADAWFRRMRFDGRTELVDQSEDVIREIGHHCIMTPSVAAGLLVKLHHLPKHNEDMPDYPYPDLSQMPAFQ